jgi:pimeloyl-ACP methyl ester carboxylesterase
MTLKLWGVRGKVVAREVAKAIPGTRRRTELDGARIFFTEERWQAFNAELTAHWTHGAD